MIEKKRHLAKAITYRVFGSIFTGLAAFIITGNISTGGWLTLADLIIKTLIFYVHERVWYKYIQWGVKH